MKTIIRAAALAATLAMGVMGGSASAQTAQRNYENGTVWSISRVETKPGMFDDYMAYLNGNWRAIQEAGKRAGDVVSYKVLALSDARDHEPDVILMVEYRNMAVFDRSQEDLDRQTAAIFGSSVKANQSAVSRESLRTLRGSQLAREVRFSR